MGALEDRFYVIFAGLLGLSPKEADRSDSASWGRLRQCIADRFAERDREHWEKLFEGTDACVAPVLSMAEAPAHRHMAARANFASGTPAPAPRFGGHPGADPGRAPRAGEHTVEVLAGWLPAAEVDQLLAVGVVARWPLGY